MSLRKPIGDPNILSKPLPPANPRYNGALSSVDCGVTVNVVKRQMSSEPSAKPRSKDELFRRVRPSTLATYVTESINPPETIDVDPAEGGFSSEFVKQSISKPRKHILILDVRDREEYDARHIISAVHYPSSMLSRSMNPFIPEIFQYKNKENHYLLLYDNEEEVVVQRKMANILFEKGIDNVLILAGGFKEYSQMFPETTDGKEPVVIDPKRPRLSATPSAHSITSDLVSTVANSSSSTHKPRSLANSLAKRSTNSAWR